MMAAKWLGVAPWDLAAQPADWLAAVETVMGAENAAAEEMRRRADRQAKARRGRGF